MGTRLHRAPVSTDAAWRCFHPLLRLLLLWTVAVNAFAAEPAPKDPPPTATLLTIEGKVEGARQGGAPWTLAQTNMVLRIGDRLRTGLRSRATLRWSEMSVVRVNQLTSMELQPPPAGADKPQLELKSGA